MKAPIAKRVFVLIVVFISALVFAQTESRKPFSPLDEALKLYQQYSGKTVLRSSNLPILSEFEQPIPSSDTNGMKVVLESELAKHGVEFVPLREAFVLAVESGWKKSPAADYITSIKLSPKGPDSPSDSSVTNVQKPAAEELPAGTIDFRGADLNAFLDLYGMLINRNILRSMQISSSNFKLRTQTPLTKGDAIYMLKVLLALSGIASVDDGTNFVQIVPLKEAANLKLEAPQRNPDEPLLESTTIRDLGYSRSFPPRKAGETSRPNGANDLVAYYAQLTDRTAVPSKAVGGISILFKAQTRLTKRELLYALETSLALNGLAIIELDDNTIRAGYIHERNQAKK